MMSRDAAPGVAPCVSAYLILGGNAHSGVARGDSPVALCGRAQQVRISVTLVGDNSALLGRLQ